MGGKSTAETGGAREQLAERSKASPMQALSQMNKAVARFLGTKALPSLQPEDRLASSPLLALPTCAILSRRRKNGQLSRYYACGDDTRSASQRLSDISFLAARSHEIGAFQLEVG
jgi:hypothetical protein